MRKCIPRANKWRLLVLIPVAAITASAIWSYPRDLDLSQVKSSTVKNDSGQAAQLLWWTPPKGVEVMQAPMKGDNADGRIMPEDWWMDGKYFKVAELGNAPQGMVRVRIHSEDGLVKPSDSREGLTYIAQRKDLSRTINANRVIGKWFDDNLSTDGHD